MEKILVSACLLGEACRYDGKSCPEQDVIEYVKDKQVIKVCPEVLGGLPIPRIPCEIRGDRVIDQEGIDKTDYYILGAEKVLMIAKKERVKTAILKSKSPSCGKGLLYDGSFCRKLVAKNGICATLLEDNGVNVINSDEIALEIQKLIKKAL